MKRPALSATMAAGVLLLLAVPALSLQFGNGALRQFPADHETRVGAELAGKLVPAGESAPTLIVANFDGAISDPANQTALQSYITGLKAPTASRASTTPVASDDGKAALIKVVPAQDPESEATLALVERLRDEGGQASGSPRSPTSRSAARARRRATSRTRSPAACGRSSCSC